MPADLTIFKKVERYFFYSDFALLFSTLVARIILIQYKNNKGIATRN